MPLFFDSAYVNQVIIFLDAKGFDVILPKKKWNEWWVFTQMARIQLLPVKPTRWRAKVQLDNTVIRSLKTAEIGTFYSQLVFTSRFDECVSLRFFASSIS